MIEFYSFPTPNCQKVAIFLEETGLHYETRDISLADGEQKLPAFTAVNPNARIPAIIDRELDSTIWESGAILIHLAEKTGQFLPRTPCERAQVIQWLMFQMSGLGPNQGAANVFGRYASEKVSWIIERYQRETRRIYSVLNDQLAKHDYLAGDYSIADMAAYPWVRMHDWAGVSLDGLDHLQEWRESISERSAVQRTKANYEPDLSKFEGDIQKMTKDLLN